MTQLTTAEQQRPRHVFPLEPAEQTLRVEESLCSAERLEVLLKYSYLCANMEGEFWELGVYKGGSAQVLAHYAKQRGRLLRLFDSFAGVPAPCNFDDCGVTLHGETTMHEGEWAQPSIGLVEAKMPEGCRYQIHAGFIPETFAGLEASRIAFAHVDLDLYHGTRHALEFLYPRMAPGGVIVIDDYGYPRNPGVQQAVRDTRPVNYRIWSECECQAVLKRNVEYGTRDAE
jgi:hypothetical protein